MRYNDEPTLFVRRLRWNTWNERHIARHRVTRDEVEEVCHGNPVPSQTYKDRLRVVGPTRSGRMLTVILAPEGGGVYYPVTARPASRKERLQYREQRGDTI